MIELKSVSKSYGGSVVLAKLDLTIASGRTAMLIGPSGCGKSTLLRLMIGLVPPDTGSIAIAGTELTGATVIEVRAHDRPGLLWRIGRALGDCGLDVRAARVETLGAEAVDVFYVVDASGGPVGGARIRGKIAAQVLAALTG